MAVERIKSFLSGRWQEGQAQGVPLLDPSTEEVVATADTSGLDLSLAIQQARTEGGAALRKLTFGERGALLQKMSDTLHKARESLIESEVINGGCTRSDAKFDVDGAIGTLAAYAELGKQLGDRRILADGDGIQLGRGPRFWGQHVYTPRAGLAVFINAFNFPAWGFAEKAACALLAGMPVFTKPATATALTAFKVVEALVNGAVLPSGALSFVGGAAGDMFHHLGPQDVIAFTGSAETGRHIRSHKKVIERSIPVNVEADSLNAAVLGPDVELGSDAMALFLSDVVRDMHQKTGQKCTAIRRIMVPAAVIEDVQAELAGRLADLKVGRPSLEEVRMGPLATRQQLEDVRAGVKLLAQDGVVVFGNPEQAKGWTGVDEGKGFFHPLVLLRVAPDAEAPHVHTHEVFGPVATLVPYGGEAAQAIELVRRGGGGLVASVYSDDKQYLEEMILGVAPYHGRLYLGGEKVRDHATGPGTVLPYLTHGGPGRAGGGEELGGLRGMQHFMQRTAIQGYRPIVESLSGTKSTAS